MGKPFSLEHAPSEVQWWGWSVKWEGGVADWKYCLLHLFSSVFCPFRGCNKIKSKGFPRRFREVPSSGERGEKGSRWGAAKLKVGRGSLWPGLAVAMGSQTFQTAQCWNSPVLPQLLKGWLANTSAAGGQRVAMLVCPVCACFAWFCRWRGMFFISRMGIFYVYVFVCLLHPFSFLNFRCLHVWEL